MAAPKGNQFYKNVKLPGPPRKYKPQQLLDNCMAYLEWAEKNPLYEMKVFSNGKTRNVPKMRAVTEKGFCLFSGMPVISWEKIKKNDNGKYDDFVQIVRLIGDLIYQIKFEGAAADLLNPAIIIRELGLVDKVAATDPDGNPVKQAAIILPNGASINIS
jgi:hypothetical protein